MRFYKNADGTFSKFAYPGGFTLIYILDDGAIICADCANGQNGSLASESSETHGWKIICQDTYDEGPDLFCDHCGGTIESSYGSVDYGDCHSD